MQEGSRRQDALACCTLTSDPGRIVGVLCDGAGSATKGGEGAALVARLVTVHAREFFAANATPPDEEALLTWIDETRDVIHYVARERQLTPRDFATTLICVLSTGTETTVVHIGDGCAVAKDAASGQWQALTWPSHGEYASTTFFITDEQPRIAIQRHMAPISALVAFTDGLERLALNFAAGKPHPPFFEGIVTPVLQSLTVGRDGKLSHQLARYLDSPAVNARTDDDKSLLVAVLR